MTSNENKPRNKSRAAALLLCVPVMLLAGCSQDFASIDDVHVPSSVEERFPIQVVDKPVKMSVSARSGKLPPDDVNRLVSFARAAKDGNSSPVTVAYPSGSTKARGVSQQAVKLLVSQGVPRSMIHAASYTGKSDVVSLSFTRRTAATNECGDWSKNLGENAMNEPFPNFGCSMQNNFAAMVANPEDFERPREMGPVRAAGQMPAMRNYNSGEWSRPEASPQLPQ